MEWNIDENKQIHFQLVEEIIKRIVKGIYQQGNKIPSVRDLALEAKVNPNTMQKALLELEDKKIIFTKRTTGKYVTDDKKIIKSLVNELSKKIINNFFTDMEKLGITKKEAQEMIGEKIND